MAFNVTDRYSSCLVFALVLILLGGPSGSLAFYCAIQNATTQKPEIVICDSPENIGCYSMIVRDASGNPVEVDKNCLSTTRVGLQCVRAEMGAIFEGNCLTGPLTKDWPTVYEKCLAEKKEETRRSAKQIPADHTYTFCSCNDANDCNRECKCDPSYAVCGAKSGCPPPPTYDCHCEQGVGPPDEPGMFPCRHEFYGAHNEKERYVRKCDGDPYTLGCWTVSQEGGYLYKGCVPVDKLREIQCVTNKLKKIQGPGNCVISTVREFVQTLQDCGLESKTKGQQQRHVEDQHKKLDANSNAKIKACHCLGVRCNMPNIVWENKGERLGHGILGTLAAAVMIMVAWNWNGF